MGREGENFERQGRNFLGGNQIFQDREGGTSDAKIIMKMILIQVKSEISLSSISLYLKQF